MGYYHDDRHWDSLSNPVLWMENWRRDGVWSHWLGLPYTVNSVEKGTFYQERVYTSYPSGAYLAGYLVGFFGEDYQPENLSRLSHFWQLVLALLLSALAFVCLHGHLAFGLPAATLLSLVPGSFALLLPGPMYWYQNTYLFETVALVPLTALLLLEAIRDLQKKPARWIWILQGFACWAGLMCEYLVAFISVGLILKRVLPIRPFRLNKAVPACRDLLSGIGGAISVFCLLLTANSAWMPLYYKFLERTNLKTPVAWKDFLHWTDYYWGYAYMGPQFGPSATKILIYSLAFLLLTPLIYRKWGKVPAGVRTVFSLGLIVSVSCVLHTYILRNHAEIHAFNVLKYLIPFSLLPFVFVPALALGPVKASAEFLGAWLREKSAAPEKSPEVSLTDKAFAKSAELTPTIRNVLAVASFLIAVWYLVPLHETFPKLFPPSLKPNVDGLSLIRKTAKYEDVVFSRSLSVDDSDSRLLSRTLKWVHLTPSPRDIQKRVAALEGKDFKAVLLFRKEADCPGYRQWILDAGGTPYGSDSGYELFRMPPTFPRTLGYDDTPFCP